MIDAVTSPDDYLFSPPGLAERRSKNMQLRSLSDPFLLLMYRCRQAIASPTDALPLDILRIISGLLLLAYFLRTLFEAPDISAPGGLIDHQLSMEMFWFTRMGLFQSWMNAEVFQAIFVFACLVLRLSDRRFSGQAFRRHFVSHRRQHLSLEFPGDVCR